MFEERLRRISDRLGGAVAVALVAADGIPVESLVTEEGLDVEVLAVELLTQMRAIADDHGEFEIGTLRQLTVTSDRYLVMLGMVTESYYLMLITARPDQVGRARFELRRAPLALAEDLY